MPSLVEKYKHLDQIIFWLFMFFFIFDYQLWNGNWQEALCLTAAEIVTYMLLVYANLCWIAPSTLNKWKWPQFLLFNFIMISVYVMIMHATGAATYLYDEIGLRSVFSMFITSILFLVIASLYWYYRQARMKAEEQMKLKAEKLDLELRFLKAQLSPHFIFNTLNNIYSLILQKHDNAATMVAKLSKIMRYTLYDANQDRIEISKEIKNLQNYIELFILSEPVSNSIKLEVNGQTEGIMIAPMILINFIENAFKHGDLSTDENAWLHIHVTSNVEEIIFDMENTYNPLFDSPSSGIGLANIKSQLAICYPEKHALNASKENGVYKTKLRINRLKECQNIDA